ncbi:hypothetical protein RJ639_030933 [Escallonia herrerae]|uniref:Bifunctional inhibitor/plant lipid transfer protein/seed storage helical domain-containing protein n=1 Tax=Escallonia herrerae TaxID=1293975 RepID=A0AA88X4Z8_9ASTE|nr:hypothetical protein RJ639_030933 [Escallonia herrerae]
MRCTLWVVTLVVLALITTSPTNAFIDCNDVIGRILECSRFVMNQTNTLSKECCDGVEDLARVSEAASQMDRQLICDCFWRLARFWPFDSDLVRDLPDMCPLKSDFAIDPDADCTQP